MSPYFKLSLMMFLAAAAFVACDNVRAETTATPYISLGAYHRDCALTDKLLCQDGFGSDTPGTIDIGLRFEASKPKWFMLYADEVDLGYHHQSYIDRGVPFNDHDETYIDMYGIKFTWLIKKYSFTF